MEHSPGACWTAYILLEEPDLRIEGVSGTSAGAMNGAIVVFGLMDGGRSGARTLLSRFWRPVAETGQFGLFQPSWLDRMMSPRNLDYSIGFQLFDIMTRTLSPYDVNPDGFHSLRDVLLDLIDFDRLRKLKDMKLFVSTTTVRSGKIRVFNCQEMCVDVLLASACLPTLFPAVEIDGEAYWDGGYMGNPALFPLVYECRSPDILLIELNPLACATTPRRPRDIINRIHDISFNAPLMRERRAIAFVTCLLDKHELQDRGNVRQVLFHMIEAEPNLRGLGASSRFNCEWEFLLSLKAAGRAATEDWLAENGANLGVRSSVDIRARFL
jgi:NTE family protein